MRLLTHNFLQSNVRGTENGYPLIIEAEVVVLEESPLDTALLLKLLPKLDYSVILGAVAQLSASTTCTLDLPELPSTLVLDGDELQKDTQLLTNLHTVLMDVHLVDGNLICPDTGRKFPVKEGIPNMILHEDEV
ncbi:tRNA methyltransferase-like protein [Fragilaria crotonensis]|nr:tRNA methyltransferase-like protein [Fragilaria crotonensis]